MWKREHFDLQSRDKLNRPNTDDLYMQRHAESRGRQKTESEPFMATAW